LTSVSPSVQPRGLVVPILRNADQMSFADIEKKIAEYGAKARDGKLGIEEMTGGTFSISNGGVFGSMLSTPIINPPQSAILGVHATKDRAVVENGQIVVRPHQLPGHVYDHRIIDGREAVLGPGGDEGSAGRPVAPAVSISKKRKTVNFATLTRVAILWLRASMDAGFFSHWTKKRKPMSKQFRRGRHWWRPRRLYRGHPRGAAGLQRGLHRRVEKRQGRPAPGGTCTNVGCIPSKALLQSSEHFEHANHHFADHGIDRQGPEDGRGQDDGAQGHRGEAEQRRHPVPVQEEQGQLLPWPWRFRQGGEGRWLRDHRWRRPKKALVGKQVVVATGSNARALPGTPFDEVNVLSNDGALRIGAVPKKLGLIGSGVIGLEMGSVWRRLGADVTILEGLPTFLGAVDEQIAKEAKKAFDKQGLKIELGVKVGEIKNRQEGRVTSPTPTPRAKPKLDVDKLIVSIGRVPNTIGLNAEAVGLQLDERGAIVVDGDCKTNLPGVWAVGDVVRGPMLAHKAEEEGVAVAERMAGQHGHVNFNTIPWVIYTSPEIAWVGRTEQQLKADGVKYKAGTFPFLANGRARALGDTTGMVKFLADATTDEILGVHMVGPHGQRADCRGRGGHGVQGQREDIARICHAHPSLSEATKEAALAVDKRTLNF
jgi:dihydrolipoamide dehydrogenase